MKKAALISVGTEVVSGQIQNTNINLFTRKLEDLGFETVLHLTVPDDRERMEQAFIWAIQQAELIYITGGLGPTSDDFTRDVVAKWLDLPLVFDEPSWQWIVKRLTERQVKVREVQRQQSYFPQGARILPNTQGTAHGFYVKKSQHLIFCFPGPPREIEAIWKDSVEEILRDLIDPLEQKITLKWECLGQGESEIAHLVLGATEGCPQEIGYRLHTPFVEVKLMGPKKQQKELDFWEEKISEALKPYCVSRGEDFAQTFVEQIHNTDGPVEIYDTVTGGALNARLASFFFTGNFEKTNDQWNYLVRPPTDLEQTSKQTLGFYLSEVSEQKFRLTIFNKGHTSSKIFESPYPKTSLNLRRKMDLAERFFIEAVKLLPALKTNERI